MDRLRDAVGISLVEIKTEEMLKVESIARGSPLDMANQKINLKSDKVQVGDYLTILNHTRVSSVPHLIKSLRRMDQKKAIRLQFERPKRTFHAKSKIGMQQRLAVLPQALSHKRVNISIVPESTSSLGIRLQTASYNRSLCKMKPGTIFLNITRMKNGSLADLAKMQLNDLLYAVNGKAITSLKQALVGIKASMSNLTVSVCRKRSNESLTKVVKEATELMRELGSKSSKMSNTSKWLHQHILCSVLGTIALSILIVCFLIRKDPFSLFLLFTSTLVICLRILRMSPTLAREDLHVLQSAATSIFLFSTTYTESDVNNQTKRLNTSSTIIVVSIAYSCSPLRGDCDMF